MKRPSSNTTSSKTFQEALRAFLLDLAVSQPFYAVFPLLLLQNGDKVPKDHKGYDRFEYSPGRVAAARHLLRTLVTAPPCKNPDTQEYIRLIIEASTVLTEFYAHLAHLPVPAEGNTTICLSTLPNYNGFTAALAILPLSTALPEVFPSLLFPDQRVTKRRSSYPRTLLHNSLQNLLRTQWGIATVDKVETTAELASTGLSRPKIVTLLDSVGLQHKLIVKGRDDLRQDAVMEQLFFILNKVFTFTAQTFHRGLSLRTYQVVPLTPLSGIAQWVSGTVTLSHFLVDVPRGAHNRYQSAMTHDEARQLLQQTRARHANPRGSPASLNQGLQEAFRDICERFTPAFHVAFMELFPFPLEWVAAMRRYARSLAATSMVGFLMGIGDRHLNNILIDTASGELVHIDFGVVFDRGKDLGVPEIVPFRLTRDLVVGLGPLGFDGPFRMSCETTLEVLKDIHSLVLAVLEVFVHDPLYIWAVTPRKSSASTFQNRISKSASSGSLARNAAAQHALHQVRQKLLGFCEIEGDDITITGGPLSLRIETHPVALPIPSLVDRLLRQASSSARLAHMFAGWAPWV